MDNTGLLVEDGDMMFRSLMTTAALVCTCLWGVPGTAAAQNSKSTNDSKCPAVLQHTVERLQDEKPQNLCQYAGQVVLVVNTASFCGFTPQYKSLEELYARYKDKGLVVLGFPSNDFAQEPGNNQKIADFCENTYGVKFPMFTKTTVRGNDALPLFKQLTQLTDTSPKWNFYKYLISRDGKQVKSYNSTTDPLDPKFLAEVDRLLSAKTP
jgi:glutathione peroxidase